MTRLVAALREYASWDQFRGGCQGCAMEEAADEIERLRMALRALVGWWDSGDFGDEQMILDAARAALALPSQKDQKEV